MRIVQKYTKKQSENNIDKYKLNIIINISSRMIGEVVVPFEQYIPVSKGLAVGGKGDSYGDYSAGRRRFGIDYGYPNSRDNNFIITVSFTEEKSQRTGGISRGCTDLDTQGGTPRGRSNIF